MLKCYIYSVKLVKYISAILLGLIFLVSSSGFMIYKSHCACTGTDQVTIFIKSEICKSEDSSYQEEEEMSCCSSKDLINDVSLEETSCCASIESNTSESHSVNCDCNNSEVTYLKLKNQIVKEEVKFMRIEPIELVVFFTSFSSEFFDIDYFTNIKKFYVDLPFFKSSALDFLIQIQQLKIPALA